MGDFQVIETQEQLDAIIGERIKREKETVGKKYEGYISPDDFKAKTEDFNKQIGDLNKALKDANDKIAGNDKAMAEKDAKIRAYESHSVKTRIAHETGLSYDAVDFLKGDDEESIRKSAESLKAIIGSPQNQVPPLADPEGNAGNDKDAALRNTIKNLNKGD